LTFKKKYWNSTGRFVLLPAFLISFTLSVYSQFNFPLGSRPAALANTYVMESDLWSVSHNQAGLGFYDHFAIGFHHENKFLVKEQSLHAVALAIPVKPGTFGLSYSYFGYEMYNESKIGLGFGKTLGEKFSAGVQLNYHRIFIQGDFGNRNSLSVEGGIQYRPVKSIAIGIHLFNPTKAKISPNDQDTIPTILRAGFSYKPYEKLWLGLETEKTLDKDLRVKAGVEYRLFESLFLRTGIVTNPVQNTFGLGYEIAKVSADIAFTHHEILGFTPHFTIRFKFR
jgi:hypothetical protein